MTSEDFKTWRLAAKLTQAKAGDALGITKRCIQKYESGELEVPRAIALACEGLDYRKMVNPDSMFTYA